MDNDVLLERLENAPSDELKEMKLWLFFENIRLKGERLELEELRATLEEEQFRQQDEQRSYLNHLAAERNQVRQDEEMIAKKLDIIKKGFADLEIDRKKLQAREAQLNNMEAQLSMKMQYAYTADHPEVADVLFRGVNSYLSLRKRYKDLMKMYHPDCLAGDSEMVLAINRAYEKLRRQYDEGLRQA